MKAARNNKHSKMVKKKKDICNDAEKTSQSGGKETKLCRLATRKIDDSRITSSKKDDSLRRHRGRKKTVQDSIEKV